MKRKEPVLNSFQYGFDEGKDGRVKNNHLVFILSYRTHKSTPPKLGGEF